MKEDGEDWRASLEDVVTGELHGFPDLAALLDYLGELDAIKQDDGAVAGQEPGEGRGNSCSLYIGIQKVPSEN